MIPYLRKGKLLFSPICFVNHFRGLLGLKISLQSILEKSIHAYVLGEKRREEREERNIKVSQEF